MMKKLLSVLLVGMTLAVANGVDASGYDVMKEIQAVNKKIKIKESVSQNMAGAYTKTRTMYIYKNGKGWVDCELILGNGIRNSAFLVIYYTGPSWYFWDYVVVGDGYTARKLIPDDRPTHRIITGRLVEESFLVELTEEDLEFMRNAKVLRVVSSSKGSYTDLNCNTYRKNRLPFNTAVDYALKFVKEIG